MARIALVTRDAVLPAEQSAYDAFSASRGGEPKIGPYSIIAHMPEMAQRLEALRTYIRNEDSLSRKLQDMAVLTVARDSRWPGWAQVQRCMLHVRLRSWSLPEQPSWTRLLSCRKTTTW